MTTTQRTEAETIIAATRAPQLEIVEGNPFLLVPEGFKAPIDLEKTLPNPLRKRGTVTLNDADSFIRYTKDQGAPQPNTSTRIYCETNYVNGNVRFVGVLNDYDAEAHWQDFRSMYEPPKAEEWKTWVGNNKKVMDQMAFALFIEDNLKDIAGESPSGTQMLEMAKSLEIKHDHRVKSAVRTQSAGISLEYVATDDAATVERMTVFDRFSIGIAPFFNGQAYKVDARLRYRIGNGTVQFWFELIRPDLTLQAATVDMIEAIKAGTGFPVLMGKLGQ